MKALVQSKPWLNYRKSYDTNNLLYVRFARRKLRNSTIFKHNTMQPIDLLIEFDLENLIAYEVL